jgi:molecular chaperone IbpA
MRTAFDFSPFYRSSIGFDRVFNLLENANRVTSLDNWPPYDIVKTGDDSYRISMAVAGFGQSQLSITQQQNMLVVSGEKSADGSGEYLHRGIAGRDFERRFELADPVKVSGAALENGLLTIDLKREIPEAMKPRRIEIGAGEPTAKIEHQPAAEKKAA